MKKETFEEIQRLLSDIVRASDPKSIYIRLRAEKIMNLLIKEIEILDE